MPGFEERKLFHHVLKLAYVSGPAVELHCAYSVLGEGYRCRHVLVGEVRGEFAGEQLYVASAVVQSGHVDTDGGESVIQIFAEFTLAHRLG